MIQVNIHEAKTHLSKLIAEGREVVIAKYGEPVARLIPIRSHSDPRKPGSAGNRFSVPETFFDRLPEEIIEGFYK